MRLSFSDVHARYSDAEVLRGVDLHVPHGETTVLLGRNGMGKTSLLRCTMGFDEPRTVQGSIQLDGKGITGLSPHRIVALGIGYVPQGRRIFRSLTVQENLLLAKQRSTDSTPRWAITDVYRMFPPLQERKSQFGATLSGGEQQMLAVGRALMSDPSLLLLDEPSEGLAPLVIESLLETLVGLRDTGITILMAEQSLSVAQRMADHVAIMERGEIALTESPEEFANNDVLRQRYLGVG